MLSSARVVGVLQRRFKSVVAVLAVLQAAMLVALRPGVLSIDEVTYLAMARSASHGSLLAIENGWDLGPSPELEWGLVREVGGRLVSQYPAGSAAVAAPFYVLFGASAMFVANTVAFYATVLLTRRIARRVLGSERVALLAAMVFACATFAWEYSAAIWPHAITTLLTTAAMDAVLTAGLEISPVRARRRRVVAGLLVGLAMTFRLDAVFVLPALLLVPLVSGDKTASFGHAAALLGGTLPAAIFLGATNHAKFGTWMPLSYGPWQGQGSNTGASSYAVLGVVAVAGLVGAHLYARRPGRVDRRHLLVASALCVAALLLPTVRDAVVRMLDGLWTLVVDLRNREGEEAALTRSTRNGMIYIGTFKKSLLQSCPYLALAALSIFGARHSPALRPSRLALALPIAAYVLVFGYFRWHGGLSVNLRYFVPILPFLAILAADGLARLARQSAGSLRVLRSADVALLASAAIYIEAGVLLRLPSAPMTTREIFYLDVPLALGAVLAGAILVAAVLARGPGRARVSAAAFILGVAALAWAGLTELTYDAVAVARVRIRGHMIAAHARQHIGAGSFVVVEYLDPVAGLLENDVVLATGPRDAFADTARLASESSCRGKRAYAILHPSALATLERATAPALQVRILEAEPRDGLVTAELVPLAPACVR